MLRTQRRRSAAVSGGSAVGQVRELCGLGEAPAGGGPAVAVLLDIPNEVFYRSEQGAGAAALRSLLGGFRARTLAPQPL